MIQRPQSIVRWEMLVILLQKVLSVLVREIISIWYISIHTLAEQMEILIGFKDHLQRI